MTSRNIYLTKLGFRSLLIIGFVILSSIVISTTAQASALLVTNRAATGIGSLYQTILAAPAGAIIQFDSANCPCTYALNAELKIDRPLTIRGAGSDLTIIEGDGTSRLFLITGSEVTLENITLRNGVAAQGGDGGALYIDKDSNLSVDGSKFDGNQAGGAGGGIYSEGKVTVLNSTFVRNKAGAGGAVAFGGGTAVIANSTFTENIGTESGGAIVTIAKATIVNSTIASNQSKNGGGLATGKGGKTIIQNSIVANNKGDRGAENCLVGSGGSMTGVTNLEFGAATATCLKAGFKVRNPKLASLKQDKLGSTETMAIDKTSPAYDSGTLKICQSIPVNKRDQRGALRPQGKGCDIGAYEVGDVVAPAPTNTPTPKPSSTPKPSNTPKPSTTPKPSATPKVTRTPTVLPGATTAK